jgi:hypothetical protein
MLWFFVYDIYAVCFASWDIWEPMLARLGCLPRAPHPAATGGGFGFGKFRRDEQGCLVQKFVAAPHGLADGAFAQVKRPDSFI